MLCTIMGLEREEKKPVERAKHNISIAIKIISTLLTNVVYHS